MKKIAIITNTYYNRSESTIIAINQKTTNEEILKNVRYGLKYKSVINFYEIPNNCKLDVDSIEENYNAYFTYNPSDLSCGYDGYEITWISTINDMDKEDYELLSEEIKKSYEENKNYSEGLIDSIDGQFYDSIEDYAYNLDLKFGELNY